MNTYEETACQCDTCKSFCQSRVGWPTPDEAQALIDAGYAGRLMLDFWIKDDRVDADVLILAPAALECEGKQAPSNPIAACSFFSAEGLCNLHDAGLKPFECKVAKHDNDACDTLHEEVARLWHEADTEPMLDAWSKTTGCPLEIPDMDLGSMFDLFLGSLPR
tara:strand:+ start:609 stop:1097 length:489 start_codon:yes stop_codon:yes gene_type:complete